MNPKLSETIYADFITSSPTTGAAVDADTLPTCEVFEDATDTAILTPAVVKRTGKTGNYRVTIACTGANGFETGKSYNAIVAATVGAVAAKAVIQSFMVRTSSADDLAASILTRATPAQVQSELVTYNAAKPGAAMALTSTYDSAKTASTQASVDAIAAKTNSLPADPADASVIADEFSNVHGKLNTIDDFLDTEIAAIKAKTDALPVDPADASDIAASFALLNGKLDTIDDAVDSEVGAIKSVTDKLDTALEIDGAVYRYTANALEQSPVGADGAGSDPWLANLPGSYPAGTAGQILGDNLDASVSSRASAAIFSGITFLGQWLGLIAGKQSGNAAARTELRATGAGNGSYDETSDSLEAIRNRGDEAWVGGGETVPPPPSGALGACVENPALTTGPTTEPPAFAHAVQRMQRIKVWRPR